MRRHLLLDIEATARGVPPSPPRPNMANETISRLAEFWSLSDNPVFSEHALSVLREVRPHSEQFPPPPCWQVECVGVLFMEDYQVDDMGCLSGKSEEEILREVARVFSEVKLEDGSSSFPDHDVVTFNGRGFDLPVLTMRAARYGIQLPFWASKWHYRYAESPHFDLLDFWSAYGGCPKVSLSQIARLFGLPGKRDGEDGNSVAAMIQEGRLEDVKTYCLSDVVQTAGVFLRTQHFRGRMTREQYRAAAMRLLEACEGAFLQPAERLAWIPEKTDKRVFLLEE